MGVSLCQDTYCTDFSSTFLHCESNSVTQKSLVGLQETNYFRALLKKITFLEGEVAQ